MSLFGSKEKKGAPGAQYNRSNNGITRRPADAPQPETQAPTPAQKTEQTPPQSTIPNLSLISLKYKDMPILILHEIDQGEQPQRIEKVIERWLAVPKSARFDVLSFPRHFYCISKETGRLDLSVELPEDYAQMAQKEQDENVREFMTKLTGEKPAAPAAGTLTAELINATSKEALHDIFYNMSKKDRQRVIDAVMSANKKRVQEANERRQQSGGGEGSGEQPPKSAPQPKPAPKQQPAAPQANGLAATRRRRGG